MKGISNVGARLALGAAVLLMVAACGGTDADLDQIQTPDAEPTTTVASAAMETDETPESGAVATGPAGEDGVAYRMDPDSGNATEWCLSLLEQMHSSASQSGQEAYLLDPSIIGVLLPWASMPDCAVQRGNSDDLLSVTFIYPNAASDFEEQFVADFEDQGFAEVMGRYYGLGRGGEGDVEWIGERLDDYFHLYEGIGGAYGILNFAKPIHEWED